MIESPDIDSYTKETLIEYVVDQRLDRRIELVIRNFCEQQDPLSITVYRGHRKTPNIRSGMWYSASTNINIAADQFAGPQCCIFIVHLVNVNCIDVNRFVGNSIGDKNEETEFIFLGGGTFYKNRALTEKGF